MSGITKVILCTPKVCVLPFVPLDTNVKGDLLSFPHPVFLTNTPQGKNEICTFGYSLLKRELFL